MSANLPAPAPQTAQHDAEFWAATSHGRLLIGHCAACDQWTFPPTRSFCPNCGSDLECRDASGGGTVYSWTLITRGSGPYKEAGAYVLAYVALEEGPTILTNIVNVDADQVAIGMPVSLIFTPTGGPDDPALPRFQPVVQHTKASDSASTRAG